MDHFEDLLGTDDLNGTVIIKFEAMVMMRWRRGDDGSEP